jgi:hypothetical protein
MAAASATCTAIDATSGITRAIEARADLWMSEPSL